MNFCLCFVYSFCKYWKAWGIHAAQHNIQKYPDKEVRENPGKFYGNVSLNTDSLRHVTTGYDFFIYPTQKFSQMRSLAGKRGLDIVVEWSDLLELRDIFKLSITGTKYLAKQFRKERNIFPLQITLF